MYGKARGRILTNHKEGRPGLTLRQANRDIGSKSGSWLLRCDRVNYRVCPMSVGGDLPFQPA